MEKNLEPYPIHQGGPSEQIELIADIAGSFTYASFQNAIPVIRSIAVSNATGENLEDCQLRLISNPPFLREKIWTIDRILAGDRLSITDRKVELDAAYLAGLNEAERGEITLTLTARDRKLAEKRILVRLLARDEWGGVADMVQLLPAFVMPNDPVVAKILRAAAEQLAAYGQSSGLDGYQSGNPKRSFLITAAIYSAVSAFGLHYAEPPASFEQHGQKVRRPSLIAEQGLATCLDSTLLFAAALEAAGLHPVVLLFKGHSAVGVWLTKRTLSNAVEPDAMELRKAISMREMLVFETTGITHRPLMTLDQARQLVERRLDESQSADFVAAVDIHRSRSGGITPLASHVPMRDAAPEASPEAPMALPLPQAPSFDELPSATVEQKPTTAAGRIERWQRKLLDLSLRNNLLNLPNNKKTIPFLCTDLPYLEDRLAAGTPVRLISLPEQNPLGERDASLYREIRGEDLQRRFAADALQRDELSSHLDAKNLESRLIELYRKVRSDLAEGGANTLFLAVGFLRWKKKPDDERSYRSPLVLIPVKLERKSASSRFNLRLHEDEPRFNATLLQFLERDFDLRLPQFSGPLPVDDNGIDIQQVLTRMRQAVRDVPGMEVVDETALSVFSFAKFLMWKDLVERTDALRKNRVVRHLIDTPEQAFDTGGATFINERDLDDQYAPADIVCLLPADSSQIAASLAAAEGRDFVVIGPPGTGKSQTIANMIANCLAVGKTVLFVAEKTAALDVVYRRLREHGLAEHCLELHSSKTDRKRFLGQLKSSWQAINRFDEAEWITINDRLGLRRDQLNAYVGALHRRHGNGLTAYKALGIALRGRDLHAPPIAFPSKDSHDEGMLHSLEELADELGRVFRSVEHRPVLSLINVDEWSSGWQDQLLATASHLGKCIGTLKQAQNGFLSKLGLRPKDDAALDELERLALFAGALQETAGTELGIVFDKEFGKLRGALGELEGAIVGYREAEAKLGAQFSREKTRLIPVDALENDWREASASLWPMSWLGRRRIRKLLQSYATTGTPDPEKDLETLRQMQSLAATVDGSRLATRQTGYAGLDTDVGEVERRINGATHVRESLTRLGRAAEDLRTILQSIAPILQSATSDDPIRQAAQDYLEALSVFREADRDFAACAGVDPVGSESAGTLAHLATQLSELEAARHLLRDWSAWCRVREAASAKGLSSLVADLESGAVAADNSKAVFNLAYVRWWLNPAIDADPVLREFRRFQQEHAIDDFRQIDDLVRAAAPARVSRALVHGLPSVQSVPRNSELGLLRHQMELQRPSRSIREMIGSMPESFAKLAPCMLMSPLSIAQYLPTEQALFDVVIFDEASQITTWDAVGAIARARQTIIVGDPKQLPPTNFFGRTDDDQDVAEYERDLESILDETRAAGIPVRDLRWHYRSRSESLIAFSNHHYYQNRLITFPSPNVEDRAVALRAIADGIYDRGKSRTNAIEARAVTAEATARMRSWLALEEDERPTLGIITFNAQQQSLIQDFLDEALRDHPELEWFFSDDRVEPTIVKNLENVQGDERDVILFSITFTKDAAGKRSMDFGALNRDGGERRLNVAVTRARQELLVFSGFAADQIDTGRTKAMGVHHLKAFLDYADRGAVALPAQEQGSMGTYESPFEEFVAAELEKRGWHLVPQVGISGFRIDIGVRHPDLAGAYLAGIECDGATYHSSATARDRDKVREQVLRGLGWNILRVWSTDWWFDPQSGIERLHDALTALLAVSREQASNASNESQTGHWSLGEEIDPLQHDQKPDEFDAADSVKENKAEPQRIEKRELEMPTPTPQVTPAKTQIPEAGSCYRLTDLSAIPADPDRFYDFSYRDTLQAMVEAVLACEAPLREDILAQRIARAHGWLRTGSKIRERISFHLKDVDRTSESSGDFVWQKGTVSDFVDFRPPANENARRSILDIPIAELASFVISHEGILEKPDAALAGARALGVERLAAGSRLRLDEAIDRARTHLAKLQCS